MLFEQLDIFNIDQPLQALDNTAPIDIEPTLNIGDKVRCTVEMNDSETYYYLKYYYSNALTDVGEIVKIAENVVTVRFRNELVLLEKHQVSI